jgi:hypothetical protein
MEHPATIKGAMRFLKLIALWFLALATGLIVVAEVAFDIGSAPSLRDLFKEKSADVSAALPHQLAPLVGALVLVVALLLLTREVEKRRRQFRKPVVGFAALWLVAGTGLIFLPAVPKPAEPIGIANNRALGGGRQHGESRSPGRHAPETGGPRRGNDSGESEGSSSPENTTPEGQLPEAEASKTPDESSKDPCVCSAPPRSPEAGGSHPSPAPQGESSRRSEEPEWEEGEEEPEWEEEGEGEGEGEW